MRYSFPGINDSYLSLALFKGLESRLKGTSRLNRLGNERTRYGSSRFLPLRFHLSSYLCPFFVSMLILFLRRNSQRAISNCPKVLLFKSETILSSFLLFEFSNEALHQYRKYYLKVKGSKRFLSFFLSSSFFSMKFRIFE